MRDGLVVHRVNVGFNAVVIPGIQALIETRLPGVKTEVVHLSPTWFVEFTASEKETLDFLRPHVLPPRKEAS